MSYENAPATLMLATHCACCARPLVDAQSVEMGIGPDCRKKYGFTMECSAEARAEANQLVHAIAVKQNGLEVAAAACALRLLGFGKLADKVLDRCAEVVVKDVGTYHAPGARPGAYYAVTTPYDERVTAAWRSIPGRRWDKEAKANMVPHSAKAQLWALLKTFFAGRVCAHPAGATQIPG